MPTNIYGMINDVTKLATKWSGSSHKRAPKLSVRVKEVAIRRERELPSWDWIG